MAVGNPQMKMVQPSHAYHLTMSSIIISTADKETQYAQMADYDQTISEYYDQRTNGNRKETWSQQIEMFLGNKARLDMLEQLQKSGLIQR